MLTRITDQKILCIYIHVYQITKNWGPGLCNYQCHTDNISNAKSKGSTHVLLGKGSGEIWTYSCWEKDNFIMINEFKYGQTWKIWPSPLSLSLYSTFKSLICSFFKVPSQKMLFRQRYGSLFQRNFKMLMEHVCS